MSNPFKTKDRMNVPRDLEACCFTDDTSRELWRLAELVESWGTFLLIGILVLGTIVSIGTTSFVNEISESAGFTAFLCSAIVWGILAFLVYAGCHLISLTIRALASIVQNTRVSANVALYATANKTTPTEHPVASSVAPPQPPTPQKENPRTQTNPPAEEAPRCAPASPILISPEEIICPNCGTKQRRNRKCCFNCNLLFIKEDM